MNQKQNNHTVRYSPPPLSINQIIGTGKIILVRVINRSEKYAKRKTGVLDIDRNKKGVSDDNEISSYLNHMTD